MKDKIIRIHWSQPLSFNDAIKSEASKVQGLYYITRIFGNKETSLYLGIATKNNTIRNRLKGHNEHWLYMYRGKICVRIGTIIYPKNLSFDIKNRLIDHAESAILFEPKHKKLFPENVCKRNSYTYSDLFRIENVGDIFQLSPKIRMHEHEEAPNSEFDNQYSLINRWANDKNPVGVNGRPTRFGKDKIKIRKVDSIEKALGIKGKK